MDVNESLEYIKSKYIDDVQHPRLEKNKAIYNAILDIANKYIEFDNINDYKKYIIEEISQSSISEGKIANAVRVSDIESYRYKNGDIVFIINANDGVINTTFKNSDYLSDIQKKLIHMPTSVENTEDDKELIKQKICKIKNCTITYHKNTGFDKESPSFLNDYVKLKEKKNPNDKDEKNIIKNAKFISDVSYSKQKDLYNLIDKKDRKNYDKDFFFLNHNLKEGLLPYSSLYKIDDEEKLKDAIYNHYLNKKGMILSYTKMEEFYNCPFKFYLKNILGIDDFESTFNLSIGNIFHAVLKNIYNNDFDFEIEFKKAVDNEIITTDNKKDYLLLQKLKEELMFAIILIKEHNYNSDFESIEFEKDVIINLDKINDLKVSFKGTIDKVMCYEDKDNNKKYISIVDYKTGKANIDLDAVEHGVGLQLPIYLFLARNIYPNCEFAGFYLQKILHEESKAIKNKTRNDIRKDGSKLAGYTTENEAIIKKLDHTYQNSNFIKGLSFTKGSKKEPSRPAKNAKLFNEQKANELVDLAKEKIDNTYKLILNADFKINPYIDNSGKYKGCEYCEFADVCYKFLATEVENDGD